MIVPEKQKNNEPILTDIICWFFYIVPFFRLEHFIIYIRINKFKNQIKPIGGRQLTEFR